MPELTISRLKSGDSAVARYMQLRARMWEISPDENQHEVEILLADREHWAIFSACEAGGECTGFLEVRLREYAEGAGSSPVGYLEGWYVEPQHRRQGVGRMLVEAGEEWARSQGCTEMASDAAVDNSNSIRLHHELGYGETDRIVCFLKKL
jgi:aminoglycoside 6'-N-acetyltransferase I